MTQRPLENQPIAGAIALGPLGAARQERWGLFAVAAIWETIALVCLGRGLTDAPANAGLAIGLGVAMLLVGRGVTALLVSKAHNESARHGYPTLGPNAALAAGMAILLFIYALTIYRFVAETPVGYLVRFPAPRGLDNDAALVIDVAVNWMKRNWGHFFDGLTVVLRTCLTFIETIFVGTPWPVVSVSAMLAALWLSGWRAMIFTAACLAYLGFFGFWEKGMGTMALVATSTAICLLVGLPLGILCAKVRVARTILDPILDIMQTLPTFVYLIPAVAFFSIGKPPGVIATVIFALPPVVRLTTLGIQQVPRHVKEAADAFGATPMQLLFKVELPLSVQSIKVGINQTIMMCLSMVVVAAMIGAGGLGQDVIRSLQMLKTGQGFLAGIAIVLCAMMLDRMVRGRRRNNARSDD